MEKWLKSLAAAFISGGSTAAGAEQLVQYLAPEQFNWGSGLRNVLMLMAGTFLLSGLHATFTFLQKSPLPDIPAGSIGLPSDHVLLENAPPVLTRLTKAA